jgi:serine/threonine-protein kinase
MRGLATESADRFATAESFGTALAEAGTQAWGPGWMSAEQVPIMDAGPIISVAGYPSGPRRAAPTIAPAESGVVTGEREYPPSHVPTQGSAGIAPTHGTEGIAVSPETVAVSPQIAAAASASLDPARRRQIVTAAVVVVVTVIVIIFILEFHTLFPSGPARLAGALLPHDDFECGEGVTWRARGSPRAAPSARCRRFRTPSRTAILPGSFGPWPWSAIWRADSDDSASSPT